MESPYASIQDSGGLEQAAASSAARDGQHQPAEFDSLAQLMPAGSDSSHTSHKRVDSDVLAEEEQRAAEESRQYSWRDWTRCFPSEQSPLLFVRVLYSRFLHRLLLHHRLYLAVFLFLSLLLTALLYYLNGFAASTSTSSAPSPFTCHNILWAGADSCGYMAHDCRPFTSEPFDIRCAARCDWPNLSHRTVGVQPHYRADSYVCAAAIHAGLIGTHGGCIRAAFNGPHWGYASGKGSGGLTSEAYESWFPVSFSVTGADGASHCDYFHWSFLFVGLTLFLLLCLLRPPPVVLFYSLLLYCYYYVAATMNDSATQESIFWTATERLFYVGTFGYCMYKLGPAVTLTGHDEGKLHDSHAQAVAMDELLDDDASSREPTRSLRSRLLNRNDSLTSTLFSADSPASTASSSFSNPPATSSSSLLRCTLCRTWWRAYRDAPFTLHLPSSHPLAWHELYFLYCAPCFAALHFGYLSIVLPDIDLNAQAFTHGLAGVFVILFFSALTLALLLTQARLLFSAGRPLLRLYAACYGCVALVVIAVSAAWSHTYSFHLHHVLVAPLLFPLTRFRTRLSLVAQALLLGLFLNGFALWGFSSDWDYTPPASPPTIDSLPPAVLYVANGTAASLGRPRVVWSLRNESSGSSAIGTSLYINAVQLFHADFTDTRKLWNASADAVPLPSGAASLDALRLDEEGVAVVEFGSRRGEHVPHIHRYDRAYSPRLYHQAVAARSIPTTRLSAPSALAPPSSSSSSSSQPTALANASTSRRMGWTPLPELLGGWNYTLQACYTFTQGAVGPCTDPVVLLIRNTSRALT